MRKIIKNIFAAPLQCTEKEYLRLRERHKHDELKRSQIEQDWYDYFLMMREVISAREILDVDWNDGAHERFEAKVREPAIRMKEIVKRYGSLLGKDYNRKKELKAARAAYDLDQAMKDPTGYAERKEAEESYSKIFKPAKKRGKQKSRSI